MNALMRTPQSDGARIMKRVTEIPEATYGARHEGKLYLFNPTAEDIQRCIDQKEFEDRGYQSHKEELEVEWARDCVSLEEYCVRQRSYHARRIATFVVHGWTEPITLATNGDMIDGTHRLKAALFKSQKEVEVQIQPQ